MSSLIYHIGTKDYGKVKKTDVTRAVCHTFRKTKNAFEKHGNKDIDTERTKYNIDFEIEGYEGKLPDEIVKERIENEYRGKRAIRHDAVLIREIIANPSADVFEGLTIDQQREKMTKFFNDALPWLQKEFGEKNVIGASAHFDETTPHVHFAIMPMTDDGRLSQKDFFKSPADLKRQHREFREYMVKRKWDFDMENKYEDVDAFDLPTYKANAKKIEAKRKEQTDAIRELAKDPDLQQAAYDDALDKAYQEIMRKRDADIRKRYLDSLERKEKELERKKEELQRRIDGQDEIVSSRVDMHLEKERKEMYFMKMDLRQMMDLTGHEIDRTVKETKSPKDLHKLLMAETNGRFGLGVKRSKDVCLVTYKGGKPAIVSEEEMIRELSHYGRGENGRFYVDMEKHVPVTYVLGHYLSNEPKTAVEAREDGLKTVVDVHTTMAAEKYRELDEARKQANKRKDVVSTVPESHRNLINNVNHEVAKARAKTMVVERVVDDGPDL